MVRPKKVHDGNGLIAVLLVIRSKPGPRLVYHCPADPLPNNRAHEGHANHAADSDVDSEDEDANLTNHKPRSLESKAFDRPAQTRLEGLKPGTDTFLGYSYDSLEKLLSPGRWAEGKKFEICLDCVTFIGHPVFAREDGTWSGKNAKIAADKSGNEDVHSQPATAIMRAAGGKQTSTAAPMEHSFTHVPDSFDSNPISVSQATSAHSMSTVSGPAAEHIGMFHVVFAVRSVREQEGKDVYQHVARTLSKALNYCQQEDLYVSREVRKMLTARAKAKRDGLEQEDMCIRITESSELAGALQQCFDNLSGGDVATIRLNGMEMSLKLPVKGQPSMGGIDRINEHSGILLLEEKDELLQQLPPVDSAPLAYFIREHLPTKSLAKQAITMGLPQVLVVQFARHLVGWRKAIVIMPLHPRNTYIVAQTAPLHAIQEHAATYNRRFPALPPLAQMLRILSGKPIPFGVLIPSKIHRGPFMDILAYMYRHGFITQLKTYGWLRASANLLVPAAEDRTKPTVSVTRFLSPQGRHMDDDNVSVASVQTAVPASGRGAPDSGTEDRIILQPAEPSPEEVALLAGVQASLHDVEFRQRFPQLALYFDGEHALEEVAAKEGLKRAKVGEWLSGLEQQGCLLTFYTD